MCHFCLAIFHIAPVSITQAVQTWWSVEMSAIVKPPLFLVSALLVFFVVTSPMNRTIGEGKKQGSRLMHSFFTRLHKHCAELQEQSDEGERSVCMHLHCFSRSLKQGTFCDQLLVGAQGDSASARGSQSLVVLPARAYDGPRRFCLWEYLLLPWSDT